MYSLESKTFFVNRDVVFLKSVFPFKDCPTLPSNPVSNVDLLNYDELITIVPHSTVSSCLVDAPSQLPLDHVVPPVRRSTRSLKPPIWHKDYITTNGTNRCLYSIASILDYSGLSNKYQSFVSKFSVDTESATYAKAAQDARWVDVM